MRWQGPKQAVHPTARYRGFLTQTRARHGVGVCVLAAITLPACAQPQATQLEMPKASAAASQPAAPPKLLWPHLTVDQHRRFVDLDATVNLREGGWLELLACTPQTRTHESILVVHAKPSHIHLALITLGLEPGEPLKWQQVGDDYIAHPAHGPRIAVSIVTQQDGHETETPANQWVINRNTGQTLPESIWLFTGSMFDHTHQPPRYRADSEGSVLSLVNFSDEVLARPTDQTNQTDQGMLEPHTDRIPPVGTRVKIRLRPAAPPPDANPRQHHP